MKLVIYKTRLGPQRGFRWRLVADNGRVLCHGGQGYSRRIDMLTSVRAVLGGYPVYNKPGGDLTGFVRDDVYNGKQTIPVEDRT